MCDLYVFCFKQKTAYEMRISDWSSDVCSSDLAVQMVAEPVDQVEVGIAADRRHLDELPDHVEGRLARFGHGEPVYWVSCPVLCRAFTCLGSVKCKTWMAGTSPAMTKIKIKIGRAHV